MDQPIAFPIELLWVLPTAAICLFAIMIYQANATACQRARNLALLASSPIRYSMLLISITGFLVFMFWIATYGYFSAKVLGVPYQWLALAGAMLALFLPQRR